MEFILAFFLWFMGLLPAIIMTAIVFFINPVLGVLLGIFFVLVAVITSVAKILQIRKGK